MDTITSLMSSVGLRFGAQSDTDNGNTNVESEDPFATLKGFFVTTAEPSRVTSQGPPCQHRGGSPVFPRTASTSSSTSFEDAVVQHLDAERELKNLIEQRNDMCKRLADLKQERLHTILPSDLQEVERRGTKLQAAFTNLDLSIGDPAARVLALLFAITASLSAFPDICHCTLYPQTTSEDASPCWQWTSNVVEITGATLSTYLSWHISAPAIILNSKYLRERCARAV
jgi:hypothetical protein